MVREKSPAFADSFGGRALALYIFRIVIWTIAKEGIIVASFKSSLMKKVFLVFGIAAFSSASAQQKDVFDINRHIRGFLDKKTPSGKEKKICNK